jgi:hypothetical protein
MTIAIQQSTTQQALLFFMVLSSDHVSPATGLSPTVTISKNGAAFASPSGAVSEISGGWYKVAANATDSNTFGSIALHATAGTADNCDREAWQVVAYNPQVFDLGILTTAVTESYNADGSAPTVVQALMGILQYLMERTYAGTAVTVKKLDGSTTAMGLTLNAATGATSITRTS